MTDISDKVAHPSRAASHQPTVVLVHGGWHNARHWRLVMEHLDREGARPIAIDLPGHGARAEVPAALRSGDAQAMATTPSAIAHITLEDCATDLVSTLEALASDAGVAVVGHSIGGAVITRAAEIAPHLFSRLIYLSAYVPIMKPAAAYAALPEAGPGKPGAFVADPSVVGAVRINPMGDQAYLDDIHDYFYQDADRPTFDAFTADLTPDLPPSLWMSPVEATPARWGLVPRTYIRCGKDRAVTPALQDLFISEADAATPGNAFEVVRLEASHSPFASMPDALARAIAQSAV